ncbi:MAG: winged helix-turn-helix transcriptional regulator [Parcubacteria group bacterium]|nr:winged helix-turn-helix transcriptional regulator [Parcubacteria group bacterium]
MKTAKQLERHFKGIANHRRIEILSLIAKNNGISLDDIADSLDCNIKTISEHTRKLVQAGLVNKKYQGRLVAHSLSPYGQILHKFLKTFSYSAEYKNVVDR